MRFTIAKNLRGVPEGFSGAVVDAASYDDLDGRYTVLMRDWQNLVDEKRTVECQVDTLTAKVAALEQEIEQACVALCGECAATAGDDNYRLNRTQNGWVHHFRGTAEDWTPCNAATIRERAYQREQAK